MNDRNLELIISANSRALISELRRGEVGVTRFTSHTRTSMGQLKGIGSSLGRAIMNPLTGLLGGAALLMAGKQIVDFDSKVARMAIQARLSAAEQMNLRRQIVEVGDATKQNRDSVAGGLDAIIERTGNMKLASSTIKDIGFASKATGTQMEDMGALVSNLYTKLKISPTEMMPALNLLNVQGKEGAFTLANMANMGERLFASAKNFNIEGFEDLKAFGAYIQMARTSTGSSEMATTAVERSLSVVIEKAKQIYKLTGGFEVFDPVKSTKDVKVLKNFETVIKGVIKGTKGDIGTLQKIFGTEGIRAISPIAMEYQKTGAFAEFDKYKNASLGRENETMKDFKRYSDEASASLAEFQNMTNKGFDRMLSPTIKDINKHFKELTADPERMARWKAAVEDLGIVVGGTAAAVAWLVEGLSRLIEMWGQLPYFFFPDADPFEQKNMVEVAKMKTMPVERKRDMWERLERGERVNLAQENSNYLRDLAGRRENLPPSQFVSPWLSGLAGTQPHIAPAPINVEVNIDAARGTVEANSNSGRVDTKVDLQHGVLVPYK